MKKILIIAIGLLLQTTYSQVTVKPLEDGYEFRPPAETYYKDIHNVFNNFEGTWLYEDPTHSLKIVLQKEEMFYNRGYYRDFIVGEFEYKENGVSIMNTLSNLNNPFIKANGHNISGRNIYKTCKIAPVDDCIEGERRVEVGLNDVLEDRIYYRMIMHKRMINGQEALKIIFGSSSKNATYSEGEALPVPTIRLDRELIFYKQ